MNEKTEVEISPNSDSKWGNQEASSLAPKLMYFLP